MLAVSAMVLPAALQARFNKKILIKENAIIL